jgi:hypothetical protein
MDAMAPYQFGESDWYCCCAHALHSCVGGLPVTVHSISNCLANYAPARIPLPAAFVLWPRQDELRRWAALDTNNTDARRAHTKALATVERQRRAAPPAGDEAARSTVVRCQHGR